MMPEAINADMVARVSFGLLKSLPVVAYDSFCGFIRSCAAQNKMCAYCKHKVDTANIIGMAILMESPIKVAKIMAQPTMDGTENIKLNNNLLTKGTNGLTGFVLVI